MSFSSLNVTRKRRFYEKRVQKTLVKLTLAGFGVNFDGTNPTLSITSISMNGVNVCGGSSPTTTATTTTAVTTTAK